VRAAIAVATGAVWLSAQAPATNAQQTAPPQQQAGAPTAQQQPAFTAIVRAVVLDVIVQDTKGAPIKGLSASDFVVQEDGAPQRIDSFHEHTADDPAKAAVALASVKMPPNTFTNFEPVSTDNSATVILIDANNTPFMAQAYARNQVEKFVKTLQPGNPVAIFLRDSYMHLVQGFTSDPNVLLEAVKSKRDDPQLPFMLRERGYVGTTVRVESLSQGLQDMGRYLAGFPGRKNLVWFTASVPGARAGSISSDFPAIEDYDEEMKSTTEILALSRVSIYPVDARGLETDPAFSAANSARVPDRGPGLIIGPAPNTNHFDGHFYDHSAMQEMAADTGGKAFYNTNGISEALHEVVDNGSDFYTIAYTPTNKNWDGKFRKIRIELARGTHDVRIQCRQGYYARPPSITAQQRAAAKRRASQTTAYTGGAMIGSGRGNNFDNAMALGAIPPTEIIFNASVSPGTDVKKLDKKAWPTDNYLREDLRGKQLQNYHMLYFIRTPGVRFTPSPDGSEHADLVFVAVLYNDKGEQVNSSMNTAPVDMTKETYTRLLRGVLTVQQDIAVPTKGIYFLRFGVHDLNANRVGAMEIPVDQVKQGVAGAGQKLQP